MFAESSPLRLDLFRDHISVLIKPKEVFLNCSCQNTMFGEGKAKNGNAQEWKKENHLITLSLSYNNEFREYVLIIYYIGTEFRYENNKFLLKTLLSALLPFPSPFI